MTSRTRNFLSMSYVQPFSQRGAHGGSDLERRTMAGHRAASSATETSTLPLSWAKADRASADIDRHPVRPQDGNSVAPSSTRDGLWLGRDLLATPSKVAPA